MYLTRIAGIEPHRPSTSFTQYSRMYLTRIAGIEPNAMNITERNNEMYLTRIAGIEPEILYILYWEVIRCILPA